MRELRRCAVRTGAAGMAHRAACAMVAFAITACANPSAPPGGAPDSEPPKFVKITPTNGTVGAKNKSVLFQFDEVISETPRAAQSLGALVFVSPRSGVPSVSWRRSALEVHPRKGWRPNTVYTITLSPGISDLRGNVVDSTTRIVFSTGGPIPNTTISGVAFDWPLGRGAGNAIVEAITRDSTIYQTIADSTGRFTLEHAPIGPYVLKAFVDRNANRILDPTEAWDSTSTTLTSTATAEFYAFIHDTIGLRIQDVSPMDSNTKLKVTFDKPMALAQVLTPPQFVLKRGTDSSIVQVTVVMTPPQKVTIDSIIRKQRDDSTARANQQKGDTSAVARAQRDSALAKAARDSVARVQQATREARRLAALRLGKPLPPVDTTPPPKMHRPPVFAELYLTLEKPLDPQTNYRLVTSGVRSLSGTVRSPQRIFQTPRRAPRDTSAKNDSTAGIKKP